MIIGDLLRRNAQLYGRRTALIFEGRRFTHAEFLGRVHRLSNGLLARGLQRQERVAILARNCNEYLEAFGTAEICGFTAVNLNIRLSETELIDICRDCLPAALVFAAEFAGVAAAIRAAVPGIRIAIAIDASVPEAEDYEAVLAEGAEDEPAQRAAPARHRLSHLHQRIDRPAEGRHVRSRGLPRSGPGAGA